MIVCVWPIYGANGANGAMSTDCEESGKGSRSGHHHYPIPSARGEA